MELKCSITHATFFIKYIDSFFTIYHRRMVAIDSKIIRCVPESGNRLVKFIFQQFINRKSILQFTLLFIFFVRRKWKGLFTSFFVKNFYQQMK